MKRHRKRSARIVSILLTLSLVMGLIWAMPMTAVADSGAAFGTAADIPLSHSAPGTGTEVYYGIDHYDGDKPLLWRVVAKDDDTISLFTDTRVQTDQGDFTRQYDASMHHQWSGSDICAWLNGAFLSGNFNVAEQAAMGTYGTSNEAYDYGTIDSRQKIVLPSVDEVRDGGPWGFTSDGDRSTNFSAGWWWLRSPGVLSDSAANVNNDGSVSVNGLTVDDVGGYGGVRPAFKLNLSSILFTSAAEGGKSAAAGSALTPAEPPAGNLKFTVLDSSLALSAADRAAKTVKSGDTVSIPYTGAVTGAGRYVSAVIVDAADTDKTPLFYGKLIDCASGGAEGTASFTVPAAGDLTEGDYIIRLFNEEINGDDLTDFASTPVEINLTVDNTDNTAPTLSSVAAVARTSDTAGKVTLTSDEAGTAYYKAAADGARVTQPSVTGDLASWTSLSPDIVAATATQYDVTLSAGAQDVYIVVRDAVGNISSQSKVDFAAYAAPDTVAPVLIAGTVKRTSHTNATVKFTSSEAGQYYYAIVDSGAAKPTIGTTGVGVAIGTSENTITDPAGLTAGAKDIYIVVKDGAGNVSPDSFKIGIPAFVSVSGKTSATHKVTFKANKGKFVKGAKKTKTVTEGKQYGKLPKVKRTHYTFKGWYTKKSGGKKVLAGSKVTVKKNQTLYAHWKKQYRYAKLKKGVTAPGIRTQPRIGSTRIGYLTSGKALRVLGKVDRKGKSNDWYKVKYKGKTGYIHASFVQTYWK